ncbi:MAG: diguanylate cyclase [Eubacteriales bacterium]|nr:diguanylate cyclase [Eubacteriales bacterium]
MKTRVLPVILFVILLLSGAWSLLSVLSIQGNGRVINYTGVLRGASQLLVKEELHNSPNDALINRLDQITDELMTGEGEHHLSKLPDSDYQNALVILKENWQEVKDQIMEVRLGSGKESLYQLSEEFYHEADSVVSKAEEYTEKQIRNTVKIFITLFLIITLGICLFAVNQLHSRRRIKLIKDAEADNKKEKEKLEKMSYTLRSSLDDLPELMYVADLDTYDLLYLNKTGMQNFKMDSYEGKKCYRELKGRETPCEDCRQHVSPDGETYTWEYTNPITCRHYLLKNRDILWDNRTARLEIAFDMTRAETEMKNLKYTLKMEELIMECVRTLYRGRKMAETIPKILESLGQFLQAERSYIFLIHKNDNLVYNDFEWCKQGIEPQQQNLQALPLSFFDCWMSRFDRRECVLITDVELIKETSPEEYEILKNQNIHSLVSAPMERNGAFCGLLGVDNPPQERLTHTCTMLQTLCYFLMLSIKREEDEEQLKRLSFHDTLTSFLNRNRFIKDTESLQNSQIPVGVVYLDVNGLKEANDQKGHAYGDSLLKEAAKRLKEVFYDADLYRIGGDEFVVICRYIEEPAFNERIKELKKRLQTDNDCRAAIGSQWCAKLMDMDELTLQADAAMYADKKEFYRQNSGSARPPESSK